MARDRKPVVPKAKPTLNNFKHEVANELGLREKITEEGWENMTTREAGKVGGQMVKKMIERAEEALREEDAK